MDQGCPLSANHPYVLLVTIHCLEWRCGIIYDSPCHAGLRLEVLMQGQGVKMCVVIIL